MSDNVTGTIDKAFEEGFATNDQDSGTQKLKESLDLCLEALKTTPNDYELLWRTSRSAGEYAESLKGRNISGWEKVAKEWGKKGMDYAEKAKKADPNRVEAYFWQTENLGQYADATSLMTALKENFKGIMEHNLKMAYKIDKSYLDWSPTYAYAMFYNALPKIAGGSSKKALHYYEECARNTDWSFEGYIRRLHAAEFLMTLRGKEYKAEAKKLVAEAKELNKHRPYYLNWAKKLERKL